VKRVKKIGELAAFFQDQPLRWSASGSVAFPGAKASKNKYFFDNALTE